MPEETDKFLAVSYLTDATQYRRAAEVLHAAQFAELSSPQYFLIAQSIELFLKAFIIANGGTQRELTKRDIRHSLSRLFERAVVLGYVSRSAKSRAVVDLLDPHHAEHSFRYRKTGYKTYPTIREALDTLSRMEREISPVVSRTIGSL